MVQIAAALTAGTDIVLGACNSWEKERSGVENVGRVGGREKEESRDRSGVDADVDSTEGRVDATEAGLLKMVSNAGRMSGGEKRCAGAKFDKSRRAGGRSVATRRSGSSRSGRRDGIMMGTSECPTSGVAAELSRVDEIGSPL